MTKRIQEVFDRGDAIRCETDEELLVVLESLPCRAVHTVILHDDGCSPVACRCQPHYLIQKLTAESVTAGAEHEAEWRKASLS